MDAGYKRIFAAVDGGETQRSVMEKAIRIAAVNHADLCFGHVVDSVASEASATDMERLAQGVGERMELEYADLLKEARRNPDISSVELRVLAGSVTDTLGGIIIPEFDPDLVICCKRGLSGIRYAFVGSVSTYLIRNMRCDVLVVAKA